MQYAIIKDGSVYCICSEIPPKTEFGYDADGNRSIISPGMEYDDAIPFDFEGVPMLVDGKIVRDTSILTKRQEEILTEISRLKSIGVGMLEVGENPEAIDAQIAELRAEYARVKSELETT